MATLPRTTFSVTRKKIPAAENGKTYKFHMYPGRGHGLQGEGRASYRYEAAKIAWAKTVAWFDKYLKG